MMALKTDSQEVQFLLRQFEKGNVALFAGAGFSLGAETILRREPPLGGELAELLAKECGWGYSGEELPTVYDQASRHMGKAALSQFLFSHFRDCKPADWHFLIPQIHWYRIYTTNIDDVIENSYKNKGAVQVLRSIVSPAPFEIQDLWYQSVQCIHLHGAVFDASKQLTFTYEDFAGQTAGPNPWYQALVEDMQERCLIFVGTRLTESPFHHYLALRTLKQPGVPDQRAKAYFVTPNVSAIRRRALTDQGFVVIDATAGDFFGELIPLVKARIQNIQELWKNRYPHQIAAINEGLIERYSELLKEFDLVSPGSYGTQRRSGANQFFNGSEPTWTDIEMNVDAVREASTNLSQLLTKEKKGLKSFLVIGHAGMGKSTMMRRTAYELARAGETVYYCKSPQPITKSALIKFLNELGGRHVFIFVDDALTNLDSFDEVAANLAKEVNSTVVFSDRPHAILPRVGLLKVLKPTLFDMPLLDREDCERIIERLTEAGLLGVLANQPRAKQLQEFLGRSRKQLLVAMKEATLNKGFDEILADEFDSLSGAPARLAYTIACIAYMHGSPVRRRHLLASIEGTDIQKANLLESDLRDVIVPWRESPELLSPRHSVIAKQVATQTAPFDLRRTALMNFLTQISGDIVPQTISRRTPEYVAYRGIINFDNLLELFGESYEIIEGIYSELRQFYREGFLFHLQFGRAELHFNHFETAENYLQQSLAIRSGTEGNFQAVHQMGILHLKRARFQDDPREASKDLIAGEEILREQIRERGKVDAYGYNALIGYKLQYLKENLVENRRKQLLDLRELAATATDLHPFDFRLKEVRQAVEREYLSEAIPRRKGKT